MKIKVGDLVKLKDTDHSASVLQSVGIVTNIYITTYSQIPIVEVKWFSGPLSGITKNHDFIELEISNA